MKNIFVGIINKEGKNKLMKLLFYKQLNMKFKYHKSSTVINKNIDTEVVVGNILRISLEAKRMP